MFLPRGFGGSRRCLPGGGVCPGGRECLPRGRHCHVTSDCPKDCWDTPPLWTEFLTHACENITFSQVLLHAVKNILTLVQMYRTCLNQSSVYAIGFCDIKHFFDVDDLSVRTCGSPSGGAKRTPSF